MLNLNLIDHGTDAAVLNYIAKSLPFEQMDGMLKALGFEVQILEEQPDLETYEPLNKAELCDLIKARKITVGTRTNSKGHTVQKVRKRVLCHTKQGKEYFQMRTVNADASTDATLTRNPLKTFDAHVSRLRRDTTAHLTEEAADMKELSSTPEGKAAIESINAAIGKAARNGKLSTNLNYTNIRYCSNPVKSYDEDGNPDQYYGCVAIAKNPKTGKDQYFYSQQFQEEAAAERAQRAMVLASPNGRAWIEHTLSSDAFENEDVRDCLKLMYMYGMKSGNEMGSSPNQLGDYSTSGATTLKAGNVYVEKKRVRNRETGERETVEKVFLQFYQQGESGDKRHQQSIEITDPALAERLKAKKANASSDNDRIFSCTKDDTLAVCKTLFDCNNEDLRTAFGYRKWREARGAVLGHNPLEPKRTERVNRETGKKERLTTKRAESEITDYIMQEMGVTDRRSASKYVNKDLLKLYNMKPASKKGSKKTAGGNK